MLPGSHTRTFPSAPVEAMMLPSWLTVSAVTPFQSWGRGFLRALISKPFRSLFDDARAEASAFAAAWISTVCAPAAAAEPFAAAACPELPADSAPPPPLDVGPAM